MSALDCAAELDGPGAIVSHAEVLDAYIDGITRPREVAEALGVSTSTVRRLLRDLAKAGLLTVEGAQ